MPWQQSEPLLNEWSTMGVVLKYSEAWPLTPAGPTETMTPSIRCILFL